MEVRIDDQIIQLTVTKLFLQKADPSVIVLDLYHGYVSRPRVQQHHGKISVEFMQVPLQCALSNITEHAWQSACSHESSQQMRRQRIFTWGELQQLSPAVSRPCVVSPSQLDVGAIFNGDNEEWHRARSIVRRDFTLHVVVLGGSVTAGCGAASPSTLCNIYGSWTHMLMHRLNSLGVQTEMHVYGKNAVDPDYFLHCTRSRYLSGVVHLVLLEFEINLDGTTKSFSSLDALLRQVHAAAPEATVVFVGWPPKDGLGKANPFYRQIESMLLRGSVRKRVDLALFSRVLQTLRPQQLAPEGNQTKWLQLALSLYADQAHPTPTGHALLAETVARLLLRRLRAPDPCNSAVQPGLRARAKPLVESSVADGRCYLSADTIPLRQPLPDSWTLVDEGGAKGVRKLGYLSRTPGGPPLMLGPLLPSLSCALLHVSLSYLRSWRETQGSFTLSCEGCLCSGEPALGPRGFGTSAFKDARKANDPWPHVQTAGQLAWTRTGEGYTFELPNASVTVFTRFYALKMDQPCFIKACAPPAAQCVVTLRAMC